MKSTSSKWFLFILMTFFSLSAAAQQPQRHAEKMERYRSMKIAYFTENLQLTPEEAEKFWPLYNQLEQEKDQLRKNRRMRSREFSKQAEELTEEEAEEIIDNHMEIRQKEIQLDLEFHNELKKILPAKKIMEFYITEVQFREYMLQRIREERGEPHRGPGRQ